MDNIALDMQGIEKHFGGIRALKGVDLSVRKGEVHALLGENGAGKSTLMKILMGVEKPDSGTIKIDGKLVEIINPGVAVELGVSMIFQEFNSVPSMTVAENIFLGREPKTKHNLIDYSTMINETGKALASLGVDIDPKCPISDLSMAYCQLVEIAKAVSFNASLIIMDEPTSALSDKEILKLYSIIERLKKKDVTIIFISHKLNEIYDICDSITVLRDGSNVGTASVDKIEESELISMMVGREVDNLFPKQDVEIGETLLSVHNISRKGEYENISFEIRRGEILGFAGLMGAGRSEIVESIFGLRTIDSGKIMKNGEFLNLKLPEDSIKAGICLVPEDRKISGLVLRLPIGENIVLSALRKIMVNNVIRANLEHNAISDFISKLQIKVAKHSLSAGTLSGGNQQKVVLARCLFVDPELIILDEPTRGIDVKTKSEIHSLMSQLAGEGKAVIMVSSELPEVIGMSDRVIVLHEGRITGELSREELSAERIMELAIAENKMEDIINVE